MRLINFEHSMVVGAGRAVYTATSAISRVYEYHGKERRSCANICVVEALH